ncbi:PrsW family intramembrane metalloprotease [Candidatus Micrarchaeota archaeon]|jgi:RsiW-degrading membrane proteinase PrsW (M82 family)|nr:PrsW family intramembrane metalloprotease [Candidatus Micrarchaeota archaeon]
MTFKNIILTIFLLILFIPIHYALLNIPVNQIDESLNASVLIKEKEFTKPIEEITILATIENPVNKRFVLYLLKKEDIEYKPIQTMGIAEPYSIINLNITIKTEYLGTPYKNNTYALVLSDEAGIIKGKTFLLQEDWSKYESNTAETIAKAHILLVPAISLISILILMILIESAFHRHIKGLLVNEYTLNSLFFPKLKDRPYEEKIASIMMNPIFWIFELLLVGVLFYFIFNSINNKLSFDITAQLFAISGLSAFLFPLIYLGLVWFLEMKPLRFLWSLFLFGSVSALFAFILNTLIGEFILSTFFSTLASGSLILVSAALIAPIIEESVKGLGLLVMSGHHEYDDILAGLFFGFAIGVGFSFVENWFYFASKTNPFEIGFLAWIQLIIYRSFFNSLAHGAITGTGGAIIGYLKSYTPARKYIRLGFLAALLIAIPLHSLFNITALLDGNIKSIDLSLGLPFVFNPLFVVFLTIIFVCIYFIGTSNRLKSMVNSR